MKRSLSIESDAESPPKKVRFEADDLTTNIEEPPTTDEPSTADASGLEMLFTLEDIKGAPLCGRGGYAEVFHLEHRTLGHVALKRLRESGPLDFTSDDRRRGRREAKIWGDLQHPNILPFHGVFEMEEHFYFVSAYAVHGSLNDYARHHPSFDRLTMLAEIASAIAYLHEKGIVHGDIKAANVLIPANKHALLGDFGLSRLANIQTSSAVHGKGSTRWLSPEVYMGGHKTFESDVWAFGMVVYEVLRGRIPFEDHRLDVHVIRAIVLDKSLPPTEPRVGHDGTPFDRIWEVALRCWKENPATRISAGLAWESLKILADLQPASQPSRETASTPPALEGTECSVVSSETIPDGSRNSHFSLGQRAASPSLPSHPSQPYPLPSNDPDLSTLITLQDIKFAKVCGRGGYYDVFFLDHQGLGRIALRRLRDSGIDSDERRRARRKSKIWRQLAHPRILQLIGILELESGFYQVSPYAENGTLLDYIRICPQVDRLQAISEVASGLAYLHKENIIHGNIKASNILVAGDGHTLLSGFTTTRDMDSPTSSATHVVGSVRWMSPELLESGHGKDAMSDVWAFSMTVYEVLSNRIPYDHLHMTVWVMQAILTEKSLPPKEPSTGPNGEPYTPIWDLVSVCWSWDPEARPLMEDIRSFLQSLWENQSAWRKITHSK